MVNSVDIVPGNRPGDQSVATIPFFYHFITPTNMHDTWYLLKMEFSEKSRDERCAEERELVFELAKTLKGHLVFYYRRGFLLTSHERYHHPSRV